MHRKRTAPNAIRLDALSCSQKGFCNAWNECRPLRDVMRLDGAQGKKQVWRPHVRTWIFQKQICSIEEIASDIIGTCLDPRGIVPPCPPSLRPCVHSILNISSWQFGNSHQLPEASTQNILSRIFEVNVRCSKSFIKCAKNSASKKFIWWKITERFAWKKQV